MKSLRAWLVGIAVGVIVCVCSTASIAQTGVPRRITYQGMLEQNGAPFNGVVRLDFTIADSNGTTQLWQQSLTGVQVQNGIFNVLLGPFPESMDFNKQYAVTITVTPPNGGAFTLPAPQLLWSAPYSLNADRLGNVGSESHANGFPSLKIESGISAGNSTGGPDGTGLTAGSPQTMWADQVAVPSGTGTSLQVFNALVSSTSTITVTAVGSSAAAGGVTITAQTAGSFTVSSKNTIGTSGGGAVTALNYMIVNH